jgi:Uma2 family endonuclease
MSTTSTRITAEEYFATSVERHGEQLIEGQIVVSNPKLRHGGLQTRIGAALLAWIDAGERRGFCSMPTDVVMDEYNVFGPDVIWIAEKHLPEDLDRYPERVPDICVEIRSETTWRYDIGAKKRIYEAGGLPELWLVDHPVDEILVYRRSSPRSPVFDVELELGTGETLTSPQLPGFSLALDELFRRR